MSEDDALDRLLLERFGGKGGWGLAVEGSRRRETPRHLESLCAAVLTVCSQGSENRSATGHNAGYKHVFVVERRRHRAWT